MTGPDEILDFWLNTVGEQGWYKQDEALDQEIRTRFETTWEAACAGKLNHWRSGPKGVLAYIILTDQFPRNMYRGKAAAFASDALALASAKCAISKSWDMKIAEPERQFFYLPLMHAENLCDQERCVRLMLERMPLSGASNLLHARAHREVIRLFGRFPYRNEALDRSSTAPEMDYVMAGGYGSTVRSLQAVS